MLFLAEAFTRPPMMHTLGMVGFTQSYTYFTWRNTKWELEEYGRELVAANDYMRPNFFVNTPDILPYHPAVRRAGDVQHPGDPGRHDVARVGRLRRLRAVRERGAARPAARSTSTRRSSSCGRGTGPRPSATGRTLAPHLTRLNAIRKAHPALHYLRNLRFHQTSSHEIIATASAVRDGDDTVIVVVNLDPHSVRATSLALDMPALGLGWHDTFTVTDAFTGESYQWGERPFVRLDPYTQPAHILTVTRRPTVPTPAARKRDRDDRRVPRRHLGHSRGTRSGTSAPSSTRC